MEDIGRGLGCWGPDRFPTNSDPSKNIDFNKDLQEISENISKFLKKCFHLKDFQLLAAALQYQAQLVDF